MASCPTHERKELFRCFWEYLKETQYNISIPNYYHRFCDDHKLRIYGKGADPVENGRADMYARRCGYIWHQLCRQLCESGELERVSKNCYIIKHQTGLDLFKKHQYEEIRMHFNNNTRVWENLGVLRS